MDNQSENILPKKRNIPVVASASVVAWWVIICLIHPVPIADEYHYHVPTIMRFYQGDWNIPAYLPMWPTYHVFVSLVAKCLGPTMLVARGASMGMAIVAIWFYWFTLSDRKNKERKYALCPFIWMPFLFPFTALVYTDVASVMLVTIALFTHVRKHHVISAIVLLVACAVRQSNAFWIVLLLLWEMSKPVDLGAWHRHIQNAWPYVLCGLLVGGFFLWHGSMTPHAEVVTQIGVNPAQLYGAAITIVVLYAPIWLPRLPGTYRLIFDKARVRPAWWIGVGIVSLGGLAVAVFGYQNPHEWNQDTEFLRNYFLVVMSREIYVRWLFAIVMILAMPPLIHWGWEQPNKRMLLYTLIISLLYIMSHALVEPRYFIQPILLIGFCTRTTAIESRNQAVWYAVLSVAICWYICMYGHPYGGML